LVETPVWQDDADIPEEIRIESKKELKKRILLGIAEINAMPVVVHCWKAFEALEAASEGS